MNSRSRVLTVRWLAAWLLLLNTTTRVHSADDGLKFVKWEKEIAAFEAADQKQPPPKGGIVFVGSSSIRLWDVKKSFPGLPVINRGFGGSQIEDSTHFAERIIFPYEPTAIVFYAGDNDIASGKTAETVSSDFEKFLSKVRGKLSETQIYFVAIKPSPSRAKFMETQADANERIRKVCQRDRAAIFVDIVKPMLGPDEKPRPELFVKDQHHLNAEGYAVWSDELRPILQSLATGWPRPRALVEAKRVVFLGDSITYAGQYIAYLETYLTTRFPQKHFEFINVGLPSETCSGLSEEGHAGGKFPRPDVHERLQRLLDKMKPDLIVACYGMNCGIYQPLDDQRFAKYQDGIRRLRTAAHAAGALVIHLTPPTFDQTRGGGSHDYNKVLDQYSEWLVSQRAEGWTVIDTHRPMNAHLAERRKQNPKFVLAGDGVHAGPTGHLLMAETIADKIVPCWISSGTSVETLQNDASANNETSSIENITWDGLLPTPVDLAWDADSLELMPSSRLRGKDRIGVKPLKALRYDVLEAEKLVGTLTAFELQSESLADIRVLEGLSINQRSKELLNKITARQRLLTDAWLNEIGHLRPGMSKGKPIAEATAEAVKLSEEIVALAQSAKIMLTLKPIEVPFPGKKSDWHGFDRYEFPIAGNTASVVVPKKAAAGNPWVWHGEFFGHKPAPDIALLEQGFHIVYLSVPNMLGSPEAVSHWNVLYRELTRRYGFYSKPALVGLSRGGLYCYNWAAANPDKVACIYGDAPVCDFKSWPGGKGKGKGSAGDWKLILERFHFKNEEEAVASKQNPIDSLEALAKNNVPLLHVFGDADDVVPWDENTGVIADRYKQLGGEIELIRKPGIGHHPHGLEDSTPIVEFIRKHATK
ncbi:MAG: GDSL-type esterase/lipase family protein [Planctomycetia bacterium]|nr:GDSL-type esterase/lipase family protein [Planctomycetia bacterium]